MSSGIFQQNDRDCERSEAVQGIAAIIPPEIGYTLILEAGEP
jgi:hypothetical protein